MPVPGSRFLGAHAISSGISWSGINSLLVLTPGLTHLLLKWASVWGPWGGCAVGFLLLTLALVLVRDELIPRVGA